MASLSDFGLGPEARDDARRRGRKAHHSDESGARLLPTERRTDSIARYRAYEARQRDAEALDEEVELPGVSRHSGLLFGIGLGLGLAVLAAVGGLYLGGYVGRPVLAAGPVTTETRPELAASAFDDAQSARALELARIAPVLIQERSATAAPAQVNSPDIRVIDESAAQGAPPQANPSEPGPQAPASSNASGLSNELERLQQSLDPRGPVAPPREPSNATTAPEPSVPPPAEPTAPAETSAPESTNPY